MERKVNYFDRSDEELKLKIFWIQCISFLLLVFMISYYFDLFQFSALKLILQITFILFTFVLLVISYDTQKLSPYHFIMCVISNCFAIGGLLFFDQMSKFIIFSYIPLNILFTVILFKRFKRIIFLLLEVLLYGSVVCYLLFRQGENAILSHIFFQLTVSSCMTTTCFFLLLKMYENNTSYLQAINKQLKYTALKDPLTNLWNREYMNLLFDKILESDKKLSIVIFDIDHFKSVNDTYGHLIGDKVLKKFAHILATNIPKNAHAIRYGGEEFLIILPEKDAKAAFDIANKIRKKVENELHLKEIKGSITISGGVKEHYPNMSKESLIDEADKNLYVAKENGRNQIIV